ALATVPPDRLALGGPVQARIAEAAVGVGRNDVVRVVAVAPLHVATRSNVDGDLDVWIGCGTGGMTDSHLVIWRLSRNLSRGNSKDAAAQKERSECDHET